MGYGLLFQEPWWSDKESGVQRDDGSWAPASVVRAEREFEEKERLRRRIDRLERKLKRRRK